MDDILEWLHSRKANKIEIENQNWKHFWVWALKLKTGRLKVDSCSKENLQTYQTYLFQVVMRRNTNGRLGWRGLYKRQLLPQQCRGHPGLLHLQCTQEKENRTDTAVLWWARRLMEAYTSVQQSVVSTKEALQLQSGFEVTLTAIFAINHLLSTYRSTSTKI